VTLARAAVTGIGAISAIGHTAAATWASMVNARSGIAPVQGLQPGPLRVGQVAAVKGFDPVAHFSAKHLAQLDRASQLALVAAREAVLQAGLSAGELRGPRTAVVVGVGAGLQTTQDEQSRRLYRERQPGVHPLTIVRLMANAPSSQISIEYGIQGPAFVVSSACASANHAMAIAMNLIRHGAVDVALAGGTEACLTYSTLKAWEAMRVLAPTACRPFCAERQGLVLGEGAGVVVLESFDHASRRGAAPLAELAGASMCADAVDLVFPSIDGAARAMAGALVDAGMPPRAVGYINAHGTGTQANDVTETRAIRTVFGPFAADVAISSTKAVHGHALGAAGAIEMVAALGALATGVIPPTANFGTADPECDLDYVPNTAVEKPVDAVLSNSFAFGGLNAVLALRRIE
jgi:nodulation protein E